LGDHFGHAVHLGERDCSIQRRYQKMLEEAPSPIINADIRKKLGTIAIAIVNHIKYESAGTVEFIFDMDTSKFYFMEMNTRIQVEHPVTETISGIDLVKEQIQIAADNPLSFSQSDVKLSGHAIECRINAESPQNNFRPCPGRIIQWKPPEGQGIRVDSHCYPGYLVQPYYDSLLAKVITRGDDRTQAIEKMKYALSHFVISGVETNISFHQRLLDHPDYINSRFNTRWTQEVLLG
jgi:acetyl-CoA carboxylase, biotin carboxylase subunit